MTAGVALEVRNVSDPRHPLRLSENRRLFKLFMNAVVLHGGNVERDGRVAYLPVYMASLL